jgi:hypothetical protein
MKKGCTIFYRTYCAENQAERPAWYSKELCLKSKIIAIKELRKDWQVNFVVLHDGKMENSPWTSALKRLMHGNGEVIDLEKMGNSMSSFHVIREATKLDPDEVVFLSEDDYLWKKDSLKKMAVALSSLPIDYITGYDHPARYQPDYPLGADYPHWYTTIHIATGIHWRTQESITMTFGALAKTFKEDIEYFEKYSDNGKGSPEDRELFRHLQSLGKYKDSGKKRILMGPIPSLITHAHLPWLAPNVDWDEEAGDIKSCEI